MRKHIFNSVISSLNSNSNLQITEYLKPSQWVCLRDALIASKAVKSVTFHTRIGDEGAKYIAEILAKNTSITSLTLVKTKIYDNGGNYLAQGLATNNTLLALDISHNHMNGRIIAKIIHESKSLVSLNAGYNVVTNSGVENIAEVLKANTSLKTLNLERNFISDKGTSYLADAIEHTNSLKNLSLQKNPITKEGVAILMEALRKNPILTEGLNLQEIKVSSNRTAHLNSLFQDVQVKGVNYYISRKTGVSEKDFFLAYFGFWTVGLFPAVYYGISACHDLANALKHKHFTSRQLKTPVTPKSSVENIHISVKPSTSKASLWSTVSNNNHHDAQVEEANVDKKTNTNTKVVKKSLSCSNL